MQAYEDPASKEVHIVKMDIIIDLTDNLSKVVLLYIMLYVCYMVFLMDYTTNKQKNMFTK